MKRKGRCRLNVELDEFLHNKLKIAAKKNWMTLSTYVHRAIAEQIIKDFGINALVKDEK